MKEDATRKHHMYVLNVGPHYCTSHMNYIPHTYGVNMKECHPRCVCKLDRWESSQKHNAYDIKGCIFLRMNIKTCFGHSWPTSGFFEPIKISVYKSRDWVMMWRSTHQPLSDCIYYVLGGWNCWLIHRSLRWCGGSYPLMILHAPPVWAPVSPEWPTYRQFHPPVT